MKQKISLVWSGGGTRGIAHIGVIQVPKESCGTFDIYKAEEMVEMGRIAA